MDSHKNARLTARSRELMARMVIERGVTLKLAAASFSVTAKTAAKWVRRYREQGADGLDHSRIAYSGIYPEEKCSSVLACLRATLDWYARLGIHFKAVLTDNGGAFRSQQFAQACRDLGLKHRHTRPYTPRTNGKTERFIQTALREWAYAHTYQNSAQRSQQLPLWLHTYNWHGPPRQPPTTTSHQPIWPR